MRHPVQAGQLFLRLPTGELLKNGENEQWMLEHHNKHWREGLEFLRGKHCAFPTIEHGAFAVLLAQTVHYFFLHCWACGMLRYELNYWQLALYKFLIQCR